MESLIWFLILAIFIATIVSLVGKVIHSFRSSSTISSDSLELNLRPHLMFAVMFGIQIIGGVSLFLISWFVAMAAGGLDILEYDPPGMIETCMILPLALPLTLVSYISYIKLKGRKLAPWLLIFAVVVNVVLAIQLARYLYFHIR